MKISTHQISAKKNQKKCCMASTIRVKTTDIPTTNSGVILGPLVSTSKKRMIPSELLGPEILGPWVNLTILNHSESMIQRNP